MPFLGRMAYAYYVAGWTFPQAQIAGIALSTTSVAVIYSVMIESGYNQTELGKTHYRSHLLSPISERFWPLGIFFANYNRSMVFFIVVMAVTLFVLPKFTPWFFRKVGSRISEPETKFIFLLLFGLGGLALMAKSEAVLPAYLVAWYSRRFFLQIRPLATGCVLRRLPCSPLSIF